MSRNFSLKPAVTIISVLLVFTFALNIFFAQAYVYAADINVRISDDELSGIDVIPANGGLFETLSIAQPGGAYGASFTITNGSASDLELTLEVFNGSGAKEGISSGEDGEVLSLTKAAFEFVRLYIISGTAVESSYYPGEVDLTRTKEALKASFAENVIYPETLNDGTLNDGLLDDGSLRVLNDGAFSDEGSLYKAGDHFGDPDQSDVVWPLKALPSAEEATYTLIVYYPGEMGNEFQLFNLDFDLRLNVTKVVEPTPEPTPDPTPTPEPTPDPTPTPTPTPGGNGGGSGGGTVISVVDVGDAAPMQAPPEIIPEPLPPMDVPPVVTPEPDNSRVGGVTDETPDDPEPTPVLVEPVLEEPPVIEAPPTEETPQGALKEVPKTGQVEIHTYISLILLFAAAFGFIFLSRKKQRR